MVESHLGECTAPTPRLLRGRVFTGALLASPLAACAGPVRVAAVPRASTENATMLGGVSNARFFPDTQVDRLAQEALRALERERTALGAAPGRRLPPANFIVVSGGSDDGAFAAGLLCGWTEAGTRPEFKLVTGVSTGSLIAPFAFLGPEWEPAAARGLHRDRAGRRLPEARPAGPPVQRVDGRHRAALRPDLALRG
jgi:hypothetical protein